MIRKEEIVKENQLLDKNNLQIQLFGNFLLTGMEKLINDCQFWEEKTQTKIDLSLVKI